MTYESNADFAGTESNFLYRLTPRRKILITSTDNTQVLTWGEDNVQNVWIGTTLASYDPALGSNNTYTYDTSAETLTIYTTDDPSYIVVVFYLFF